MKMTDDEIRLAKTTDPTPLLESWGYSVIWEGRHAYVRSEGAKVFRLTMGDDGRYLSCPNRGDEKIGDNIALVMHIDKKLSFPDAVRLLTGSGKKYYNTETKRKKDNFNSNTYPILPPECDVSRGRKYLVDTRLIDQGILWEAEIQRAVKYTRGHVCFLGHDMEGRTRNIAMRATDPLTPERYRKWNVRGSDKGYPTILHGDQKIAWIVEGGVDGLAVRTLYQRTGLEPPTVIVSGGAIVLSFLDNQNVRSIVLGCRVVWLAREREKDAETQLAVDAAFSKMMAKVEEVLRGDIGRIRIWDPPEGVKDIADHNARFKPG